MVVCIPSGGEIGEEIHDHTDQVLAFVQGEGVAILDDEQSPVGPDRLVHVPAGTRHNFVNTGSSDLRLYTMYAPPEHAPDTILSTERRPRLTPTRPITSRRNADFVRVIGLETLGRRPGRLRPAAVTAPLGGPTETRPGSAV